VFGTVEVENPRWMVCQRCFFRFSMAFTILGEICPDLATPELMELAARLGSILPYRKAAELLAEFLPVDLETGQTQMIEALTIDGASTIRLLESIETLNPMLVLIPDGVDGLSSTAS
jgi:hypothetical protein